ncbi:MAG: TRAP transporter small permease [Deltaproteobacteria bacterium]|nr:TRAP transporter small permease [Deltaproteobacteria bacterium]
MSALERIDKFNRTVIHKIEWVGFVALLVMMLVTCIDVIGAKLFLSPIHGALDTVEIAQLVAISFAAAAALIYGRHIEVEFFVTILPKRIQAGIECVVKLLGVVLFAAIVWRLAEHGHYLHAGGEVSPTARIPLSPFTYGAAFACIPVGIVLLLEAFSSFFRMVRR